MKVICGEGTMGAGSRGASCRRGSIRGCCFGTSCLDEKDGEMRLKPILPSESFEGFRVREGLGFGATRVGEGAIASGCCNAGGAAKEGTGGTLVGGGGGGSVGDIDDCGS